MKKLIKVNIYIVSGLIISLLVGNLFYSCDTKALTDMDIPKYMLTDESADLGMLFSNIQVAYTRRCAWNAIPTAGGFDKYYATHSIGMVGDRYEYSSGEFEPLWGFFSDEGKGVVHLLNVLEKSGDLTMTNNIAILKLLKAGIFSWGTDLYGDIPYSEAGMAYIDGILLPKFDTQESIYKSMLPMIDEACNSLDASKYVWSKYDIIYKGDIDKWKKFGYSLMLRMAMRAAAVDPALGKQYAEKAIAGGVILSNDDNYKIVCVNNQISERNPVSNNMVNLDTEKYFKLGADFVDALRDNNDPRAKIIFGGKLKPDKPVPNSSIMNTYWWEDDSWIYTISEQQGYPHGHAVQVTTYELIQKEYTRPSRYLFDYASPVVRLAAYEMYFCIAKAAELGWSTGGRTAADMYNEGVKSSMEFYDSYAGTPDITEDEISAYIASRPYSPANLLYELWIGNYLDPFQGWFYIRQWGPDLTPNVVGLTMPRRIPYPAAVELTRNKDNYQAALSQMGMPLDVTYEGQFNYRCWWDVRR
jgi:hypothetical protein